MVLKIRKIQVQPIHNSNKKIDEKYDSYVVYEQILRIYRFFAYFFATDIYSDNYKITYLTICFQMMAMAGTFSLLYSIYIFWGKLDALEAASCVGCPIVVNYKFIDYRKHHINIRQHLL